MADISCVNFVKKLPQNAKLRVNRVIRAKNSFCKFLKDDFKSMVTPLIQYWTHVKQKSRRRLVTVIRSESILPNSVALMERVPLVLCLSDSAVVHPVSLANSVTLVSSVSLGEKNSTEWYNYIILSFWHSSIIDRNLYARRPYGTLYLSDFGGLFKKPLTKISNPNSRRQRVCPESL